MKQVTIRLITMAIVFEEATEKQLDQETMIELFLRNFEKKKFYTRVNKEHLEQLMNLYNKHSSIN